ncbi:MAG: phage integrase SAM-like domain-containing protein [Bacteroidia bacterium]|jgi:integrase|nr:phage integrase SAM-like domain-containing protein [Bacteroidia bacterium]
MKQRTHIELPNGSKVPCLHTWCMHCKTQVTACKQNNSPLKSCAHINKLRYRIVCHIPGEKPRKRVVRILDTMSFTEAMKQVALLKEQIAAGSIQPVSEKVHTPAILSPQPLTEKPERFIDVFGLYLSSLAGEGVAPHLRVVRSKGHINDSKNCGKHFCLALKKAGIDATRFRLSEISDEMVGHFHEYIVAKGYGNVTYNRFFSVLATFAKYAADEGYTNVKQYFDKVPRKAVIPTPEIITAQQFEKTIAATTYENGWQIVGKDKKRRNVFRDYCVPAFRFAAITGRRLEELLTCTWNDVFTDDEGRVRYIQFTDHKVSRIMRTDKGAERKVFTPANDEIISFLQSQGYGTHPRNDYILAPEIKHNRIATMHKTILRGFSHFFKVAHPDAEHMLSFAVLRKTYLTRLAMYMGKDVTAVSGHTGTDILKHYISEKQLALSEKLKDFSVFGTHDLTEIRTKKLNETEHPIER